MATTFRIDKAASLPYMPDDVTINPLWPYLAHVILLGVGRVRYAGGKLRIRDEDDWPMNRVQTLITLAETHHGAGTMDVKVPCWMRIHPARFDMPVPAYMPVPDVEVTSDPPVSRRPTFRELHMFLERDSAGGNPFGWAPCSDGIDYFWSDIWMQLAAEQGIGIVTTPPEAEA